jgi:hypothetical protein
MPGLGDAGESIDGNACVGDSSLDGTAIIATMATSTVSAAANRPHPRM